MAGCHSRIKCNMDDEVYFFTKTSENDEVKAAVDLLRGLNGFRKDGTFCDVSLRIGEGTVRVHKNVISVNSPYFKAMFSGNFSESNQEEIYIKDIDANSLELLIDYMYTGTLNISSDNVKFTMLTASFLQMSNAEELCRTYMKDNLNEENCIDYMIFAGNNSVKCLVESAIELASYDYHFQSIFSKNEYLELEFEEMKQLTQKLKEKENLEELIYSFVMRWINHSRETRRSFLEDFLEILNPLLISPSILHSPEIVKDSSPMISAWAARCNANLSPSDPCDHILVSRRLGIFRPLRIKLLSEAKHRQIEKPPGNITDGSYVCNGYYIYHQGGWQYGEPLEDAYAYNPIKRRWASFVPLQEARAYHRSCVLNERIFCFGGSDGYKALGSVEFTDLYSGQRDFIAPLPRAKERTGLGLHENSIYVVGGCNRGISYKCIHRFDVREGNWQELAPSPFRAGSSSCAILGESIYTTHPDTLQRYDIRANEWEMISAQYQKYPQEVFTLNGILFGLFTDKIAKFVHKPGKWENQRPLKCNLPYLQVSTNLLFPDVDEEDIRDPIFEGFVQRTDPSQRESEWDSTDEDGFIHFVA